MSVPNRSADRRQAMAAVVRRVPGYKAARERLLPRVRSNALLTDVVRRVFADESELGVGRRAFSAGHHLAGRDLDRLPVVGFDLLAVPPAALPVAVAGIARLQRETLAFRPVLVVSVPDFSVVREHGFVIDLIASAEDWWGLAEDYDRYVARRLVSVHQGFNLWHLVHVAPDGTVPALDARTLAAVRPAMARVLEPDVAVVDGASTGY